MRAQVVRALNFAQDMDSIGRADLLLSGLSRSLAPLGVVSISLNLIHQPGCDGPPRALLAHRWAKWAKFYVASGFITDDPAVRMLHAECRPFTWSEALARFPSPAAERVLDACFHQTGFKEGFVVPFRDKDGALLTATFCGPALDLEPDAHFALATSGFHFAARGRALATPAAFTTCPLTPRQLACLQGVRKGHSDIEIAAQLRISRHTVHNHIEAVKRRLSVTRRAMAAGLAWREGWIF